MIVMPLKFFKTSRVLSLDPSLQKMILFFPEDGQGSGKLPVERLDALYSLYTGITTPRGPY